MLSCEAHFFFGFTGRPGQPRCFIWQIDKKPIWSTILKIAITIGMPDQHDSAGRVLSSHVYESCAVLKQDYGHMGYKGRRPIQVLSLSP